MHSILPILRRVTVCSCGPLVFFYGRWSPLEAPSDLPSDEVVAITIRRTHCSQMCLLDSLCVLCAIMRVHYVKTIHFVSYWVVAPEAQHSFCGRDFPVYRVCRSPLVVLFTMLSRKGSCLSFSSSMGNFYVWEDASEALVQSSNLVPSYERERIVDVPGQKC